MIIQSKPDFKILKQEFDKGNIYNLSKEKSNGKEGDIAIIKEMQPNTEFVTYDLYDIQDDYKLDQSENIEHCTDWAWDRYDYIILTPEEARSYLKEIIVSTLKGEK